MLLVHLHFVLHPMIQVIDRAHVSFGIGADCALWNDGNWLVMSMFLTLLATLYFDIRGNLMLILDLKSLMLLAVLLVTNGWRRSQVDSTSLAVIIVIIYHVILALFSLVIVTSTNHTSWVLLSMASSHFKATTRVNSLLARYCTIENLLF